MPYSSSTQKKYGDNPMKKRTGFKMKGMNFGNEGPVKPKSIVAAKLEDPKEPSIHPDSDEHVGAVPTFSDFIQEAMQKKK